MLKFDIKRKINTLRDILVGKVPDPKAQVEQITIALIYKFMDDMDVQAAEWGSREYFVGEYEKFAWTNIMLSTNSGQERAYLYADGIEKMSTNPSLPQLFRDIFKNAYIPYRDPDTLNMFLKEIAEFSYDNSEDLGNAFEYLLSIMGSQGDAGMFRTPRHIIDMMVSIVDPQKNESILDPSCGTAGFLISSYKHILAQNKDDAGKTTLTADDRKRMTANFAGYDISPDMVRLARVNMYLHQFTKPKIYEYDTLTSEERWDDSFDVILANPPFMTPKGGIQPHRRFRVQAKRSEVLFVDYIAEHINTTGRAAVIVPEGIVFQSATAYKNLRKYLVEDNLLYAVISLPSGVFNPYSGVKTSILLLDKTLARQKDSILFVKMNNDGYDLGAQRREIKGSDIPEILDIIKAYQKGEEVDSQLVTLASREDIAKQGYILVGERYKQSVQANCKWDMVKIGDVCELNPKKSEVKDLPDDTKVSFVPMADVSENKMFFSYKTEKYLSEVYNGYTYFIDNDILLAKVTPCFENGKSAIAQKLKNGIGFGSSEYYVLRAYDKILPKLLYYYINSKKFINIGKQKMSGTGGLKRLPKDFVLNYQIPLPPISVQEEIVAEIEGYQKIIDGAKMIVDNYKPTIKIDSTWDMVKLGDVTHFSQGVQVDIAKQSKKYFEGAKLFLRIENYTQLSDDFRYIKDVDAKNKYVSDNDVVVVRYGASAGYIGRGFQGVLANNLFMVTPQEKCLRKEYLYYYLRTDAVQKYFKQSMSGGAMPALSFGIAKEVIIPLPPLDIQKEIVAKIQEEMAIVEQNKRLVEIFEQKIKDKISDVWGE